MTLDVNYWSEFYSTKHTLTPSPFSSFVLGFTVGKTLKILDAGCGNGRDSYELSKYHDVIGLDTSDYRPENRDRCTFIEGDFCTYDKDEFNLVYSRFTLHSITDEQQLEFLSSIKNPGTFLCIEARSDRDIYNSREHGDDHYRNFINFNRLHTLLEELNYKILFAEENTGFALYKNEDPVCVRFIVEKN